MERHWPTYRRLAIALLVFLIAWSAGRLLRGATGIEPLPASAPGPTAATYDSAMVYLHGDLSAPASRLLATSSAGSDEQRVVALLRAADWQSCEDLGRQLRDFQRHRSGDSVLLVWTEPADARLIEYRLKRERIAATVSAVPSLDSVFATAPRLPTPAVIIISADGTHADGIAHTRRLPNVRSRSFTEELPLVRQIHPPDSERRESEPGSSSTSRREARS